MAKSWKDDATSNFSTPKEKKVAQKPQPKGAAWDEMSPEKKRQVARYLQGRLPGKPF